MKCFLFYLKQTLISFPSETEKKSILFPLKTEKLKIFMQNLCTLQVMT